MTLRLSCAHEKPVRDAAEGFEDSIRWVMEFTDHPQEAEATPVTPDERARAFAAFREVFAVELDAVVVRCAELAVTHQWGVTPEHVCSTASARCARCGKPTNATPGADPAQTKESK